MQLSPQSLQCHQTLLALSQDQQSYAFNSQQQRCDPAFGDSQHRLIIISECLTLELIQQVLSRLQLPDSLMFRLPARNTQLSLQSAQILLPEGCEIEKNAMAALATHLGVELALVSYAPVLATPGLLLMDMDSTMIDCECIDDIAELAGVGAKVSEVTERAMQGELDFAESLIHRVACLQGASLDILEQVRLTLPINPGMSELLRMLKLNGWRVALASGGFSYFADYLKTRLGLDAAVANQLQHQQGQLTGRVTGAIVDAQVKADTLLDLAAQFEIAPQQTVAMGDGANDLTMMDAAQLGVAYHAKPVVAAQASARIERYGLNTLLHLLG